MDVILVRVRVCRGGREGRRYEYALGSVCAYISRERRDQVSIHSRVRHGPTGEDHDGHDKQVPMGGAHRCEGLSMCVSRRHGGNAARSCWRILHAGGAAARRFLKLLLCTLASASISGGTRPGPYQHLSMSPYHVPGMGGMRTHALLQCSWYSVVKST